jgi:NAD(P)-dependent dehydrogenase (short-subunit alcohol dehydrogenase family)
MDCFAEPVIGRRFAPTRWLAMTVCCQTAATPAAAIPNAHTVPFGRQGTGWEVACAALVLISNESSYVNAHTLFLNGGHLGCIVRG